jgi:hypothetical protein
MVRIRPDWVLVNGSEERHPEGAYYLESREGTKRTLLSGWDPATATARGMTEEHHRLPQSGALSIRGNGYEAVVSALSRQWPWETLATPGTPS